MDELAQLQSLGFTLPSPAYLFGMVVFGLIGMGAFRYGRKREQPLKVWLGVALMLYPYAVSRTWLMYVVGLALCAGLFIDRG